MVIMLDYGTINFVSFQFYPTSQHVKRSFGVESFPKSFSVNGAKAALAAAGATAASSSSASPFGGGGGGGPAAMLRCSKRSAVYKVA